MGEEGCGSLAKADWGVSENLRVEEVGVHLAQTATHALEGTACEGGRRAHDQRTGHVRGQGHVCEEGTRNLRRHARL